MNHKKTMKYDESVSLYIYIYYKEMQKVRLSVCKVHGTEGHDVSI